MIAEDLFKPSSCDALTQEALQLLFKAFSSTTERLALDHLPGGQYHTVHDPQLGLEIASAPVRQ